MSPGWSPNPSTALMVPSLSMTDCESDNKKVVKSSPDKSSCSLSEVSVSGIIGPIVFPVTSVQVPNIKMKTNNEKECDQLSKKWDFFLPDWENITFPSSVPFLTLLESKNEQRVIADIMKKTVVKTQEYTQEISSRRKFMSSSFRVWSAFQVTKVKSLRS